MRVRLQGEWLDEHTIHPWLDKKMRKAPDWELPILAWLKEWNSGSPFLNVQTSGSTGEPKNITIPRDWMSGSARLTAETFGLGKGTKAALVLPATFIAGKMMLVRACLFGWEIQWYEPSANPLAAITEPLDFIALTPPQLHQSVLHHPERLASIGTVIVGGGAVPPALAEQVRTFPNKLYATYGMTETISHVAIAPLSGPDASEWFTPLHGVRVGSDGEGHLELSAGHMEHIPISTNDLVEFDEKGRFRVRGRSDSMINSGGLKILPEEIEQAVADLLPGAFYATSAPDAVYSQRLVLVAEGSGDEADLLSRMRERLGPARAPKEIRWVEAIPRTHSGKIQRQRLNA